MNTMQTLTIKNIVVGEGRPKICVPIIGKTKEEILTTALDVMDHSPDLLEWRVDFYEEVENLESVKNLLENLATIADEVPIIFTFRSKVEGGEREISSTYYKELNQEIAKTGFAELIDVELFQEKAEELVKEIHRFDTKVIMSNHDFHKTPDEEELLFRLEKMNLLGADIAKIAVMPTSLKDVLRLLSVTEEANTCGISCPIVTMSMSEKGLISRLAGEIFGSVMTFGTVGKISAPGQIPIEELLAVLDVVHKYK